MEKTYEKPLVESVLFSGMTSVVTISEVPEPGPNEMPLA